MFMCLLALLCLNLVAAIDYSADISAINDKVLPPEKLIYQVTITNEENTQQIFDISVSDDSEFNLIYTEPDNYLITEYTLTVGGNSNKTFNLIFKPKENLAYGPKEVDLIVKSKVGDVVTEKIPYYIKSLAGVNEVYTPDVKSFVKSATDLDPRETHKVILMFTNLNPANISVLEYELSGDLIDTQKGIISLAPTTDVLERTIEKVEFAFEYDDQMDPQEASLNLKVVANGVEMPNSKIEYENKVYTIVGYADIKVQQETTERFLKDSTTMSMVNIGNKEGMKTIKVPVNFFKKIYLDSSEAFVVREEDGQKYAIWEIELDPSEEKIFFITVNYRGIAVFFGLIVLLYVVYLLTRGEMIVTKRADKLGSEQGIKELKVTLNVRNRTKHPLEAVIIEDTIPNISEISNSFDVGTLRPSKIYKNEKKGTTLVRYNIDELDPYEERVVTYRVKSKLSILGNFMLPPVKVMYNDRKGKKKEKKSNILTISS